MNIDSELKSLVALFDDTDEMVVTAVNERMLGRGISVLSDLSYLYDKEKSPDLRVHIAEKIYYLNKEFVLSELKKEADSDFPDLTNGIFLISKLLSPDLERDFFEDTLSNIVADVRKEVTDHKTAVEKVEIFHHIFYKRLLFMCRSFPVTRESTSLIVPILQSRQGSPIPMTIIYFMMARMSGVNLHPLCFFGGFVPAYVENDKALFYVDVFKEGEIFFDDKLRYFLDSQGFDVDETVFEVREDKVLLVIYLEYLSMMYGLKGDDYNVVLIERALNLFGDERFLEKGEEEE